MAASILVIGQKENNKAQVKWYILINLNLLAIGRMVRKMVKAFNVGKTILNIKVLG